MERKKLDEILKLHGLWRQGKEKGHRANLSRANLNRANLNRADLRWADLRWADLSGANLNRADLRWADLSGANLNRADLNRADLSRADLSEADLSGANLSGANLSGAALSGANLSGANNIFPIYGDKHIWYVVRWEDGIRINAGCHWFTIKEAHKYWEGKEKHGVICRASINAALAMAKARGWEK